MPYSVIQRKPDTQTFASTTTVTTTALDAGATAGSTLLLVIGWGGSPAGSITTAPSGYTLDTGGMAGSAKSATYRKTAAGGETSTSFTLTVGAANLVRYEMIEVDGLDTVAPVDVTPQFVAEATANTVVDTAGAGTNSSSSVYDGMLLTVHTGYISTSATIPTWSGHTQGAAQDESDAGVASGSTALGVSIGLAVTQTPTVYDVQATASATLSSLSGVHVVYACAGARRAADLVDLLGAEHGTMTGVTLNPNATARQPFSAVNGAVTCDAAAARTGSYGYRFVGAAAAANASPLIRTGGTRMAVREHFRYPTLPSQDVQILSHQAGSSLTVVFRYLGATNPGHIGCKVGTGTEQVSDSTITANQWFGIDRLLDARTTTYLADWAVDYNAELTDTTAGVPQTQASMTGGVAGSVWSQTPVYGWTNTATAEMHMDDNAYSITAGHYPLGDMRIWPLLVDPASTPTISGTAANFGVMTANGTIGAWNAANARDAIDDIPPTVSAAADGAVAVNASATDYAEFPMQTRNAAANGEAIRGAKVYWALWAAAATAATIRLQAFDGTTSYAAGAVGDVDYGQDNSTTAAVWAVGIVRPTTGRMVWTQAKLDALTVRFGSNDATPDIGIHAVVVEAAVRADPQTVRVAEAFQPELTSVPATVNARLDADSGAPIAYDATTPPEFDAVVTYNERGTPVTKTVPAGTTDTEVVGADTVDDVTSIDIGLT